MCSINSPSTPATVITFEIDGDNLGHFNDTYLAQLWHIGQANPAPFGDRQACDFAEQVGREIIRRWVGAEGPALWTHQARHVPQACNLVEG